MLDKLAYRGFGLTKNRTHTNYLLAIGVNAYLHITPDLHNAVNDVEGLVEVLTHKYQFEVENVQTLINEEATKKSIHLALTRLQKKLGPHDNLIIYFAGHGHWYKNRERGYWIPYDAKEGELDEYIRDGDILDWIRDFRCFHLVLISDSCFSGMFFGGRVRSTTSQFPSRWALTSGGIELVKDGPQGGNSPFAKELISLLDTNESALPFTTLATKLTEILDKRPNESQVPRFEPLNVDGHQGGQFVFEPRKSTTSMKQYNAAATNPIVKKKGARIRIGVLTLCIAVLIVIGTYFGNYWEPNNISSDPEPSLISIFDSSKICHNIYVLEFTDDNGQRDPFFTTLTNEIESLLIKHGCQVLARASYAQLKEQIENEKAILRSENIPSAFFDSLKTIAAEKVLLGNVKRDFNGNIDLRISIIDLRTKGILKSANKLIRGETAYDVNARTPRLRELVGQLLASNVPINSPNNGGNNTQRKKSSLDSSFMEKKEFLFNKSGKKIYLRHMKDGNRWLTENLAINIPEESFSNSSDPHFMQLYGRLYTWKGAKLACESIGEGWRLPSENDWETLINFYGGCIGCRNQKNISEGYGSLAGISSTGFNATWAGFYKMNESLKNTGSDGLYWTNTENDGFIWVIKFNKNQKVISKVKYSENYALSCRCIKKDS